MCFRVLGFLVLTFYGFRSYNFRFWAWILQRSGSGFDFYRSAKKKGVRGMGPGLGDVGFRDEAKGLEIRMNDGRMPYGKP